MEVIRWIRASPTQLWGLPYGSKKHRYASCKTAGRLGQFVVFSKFRHGPLQGKMLPRGSNSGRRKLWASVVSDATGDGAVNEDPERITERLLGWEELCSHVAQFASTSIGKERLKHMDIPPTYDETHLLQSETKAAFIFLYTYYANINLGRVASDLVQNALLRANKGGLIDGMGLYSILRMLIVAQETKKSFATCIREATSDTIEMELKPILSIWRSLSLPLHLVKRLSNAIDDSGEVLDSASNDLSEVRSRYSSLKNRLETKLRSMNGEVTMKAGRVCLLLPLDSLSALPGLVISTSPKEGVVYVEPQHAIDLNNRLAAAWGEMKTVEESVLWELTNECTTDIADLQQTLEAVVHLDTATAKAQYTRWISGSFPNFQDVPEYKLYDPRESTTHDLSEDSSEPLVRLSGLRHPLLLGKHLEQKEALARQARLKSLGSAQADVVVDSPPVPLDLYIGMNTRAIMITGPNTGGKTATLKSFGLTVLMAKAGLGISALPDALLPRYTSVLADVGDDQGLTSSLSTFSGHLKRIQALREVADGDCLILLDELGTGSNPEEGASLGAALVKRLVLRGIGGALTTLATTHHRLLANLAYNEKLPSIMNASVEFDEELMAPTYRLMMGVPGRSNALAIASRLGMDPLLLVEANKRVGKEKISVDTIVAELQKVNDQKSELISQAAKLSEQLEGTKKECAEMRRTYSAMQKSYSKKERRAYVQVLSQAKQRLARIQKPQLHETWRGASKFPEGRKRKKARLKSKLLTDSNEPPAVYEENPLAWSPTVGEMVYVSKLKRNARVKKMGPGNQIQLDIGQFDIFVALTDVFPMK